MVETAKDRECGDGGSGVHRAIPVLPRFGDTLLEALMRPRMVEVPGVVVCQGSIGGSIRDQKHGRKLFRTY